MKSGKDLIEKHGDSDLYDLDFRRGFAHGVLAAHTAMERGVSADELMEWYESKVLPWRMLKPGYADDGDSPDIPCRP